MQTISSSIRKKWQMVLIIPIMISMIVFTVSAFMTPKYLAQVSILVIQNHADDKVDAFAAAKSAEYLSEILSKAVYTDTFFKDVMASPYGVGNKFSYNPKERKLQWEEEVSVKKINNTGIIDIKVYDPSKQEAQKIAQAISWNFTNNAAKYHGGGTSVEIKTIDGPNTFDEPAKPDLILNTALAFILGLIGAVMIAYYTEDFDLKVVEQSDRNEKLKEDKEKAKSALAVQADDLQEYYKSVLKV